MLAPLHQVMGLDEAEGVRPPGAIDYDGSGYPYPRGVGQPFLTEEVAQK